MIALKLLAFRGCEGREQFFFRMAVVMLNMVVRTTDVLADSKV